MALEDRFIYRPVRVGHFVGDGADVSIATPDGETLHARYVPRAYAWANLLFLHGSRGCLATRARVLTYLSARGPNVLGVDYRGYGKSTGTPTEEGLYVDALAAYDWLLQQGPATSVIVLGEGLGAAPACRLAAARECNALILLSAFTSLPELAATRHPYLPTRWFVRSRFDTLAALPAVQVPKLIVHSRADERVPFEMATRLYDAATAPKESLWLDRARHEEVYSVSGEQLARGLTSFVAGLNPPS